MTYGYKKELRESEREREMRERERERQKDRRTERHTWDLKNKCDDIVARLRLN